MDERLARRACQSDMFIQNLSVASAKPSRVRRSGGTLAVGIATNTHYIYLSMFLREIV